MSTDPLNPAGDDHIRFDDVASGYETTAMPKPVAHGAAIQNVLADLSPSDQDATPNERETLYATAVDYWRANIANRDVEPYIAERGVEDRFDWVPNDGHEYGFVVRSSKWMAGTETGGDYRPYYQQDVLLRRIVDDDDAGLSLEPGPVSLRVEIMPQYRDLVYQNSRDPLPCPYGEGTRLQMWTTWAEEAEEVEQRAYDALVAVYGSDALNVGRDRVDESRRIAKAETHIRFDVDKKPRVVEALENSKDLIAWGGHSEIEAGQQRDREGWSEVSVESDRWDLLGFDGTEYGVHAKIYQAQDWHKRPESDYYRHPKFEAAYAGVDRGANPHVDDWDDVMTHLRTIVATHAYWGGLDRADHVEDDYFDGAFAEQFEFERPIGRREMLRRRYQDLATEVYREALKESTDAVYDILKVVARADGATYDHLEQETGLARSTIRYHVARLAENGVVARRGNPVLVTFVSKDLWKRATEILAKANPDDTQEDLAERAQERRERREERDEPDDTEEGGDADDTDGDASTRTEWLYLDEWGSVDELIGELTYGDRTPRDVRVRDLSEPAPG
ncbi:MarR family transcriptional regulator [Halomicrobium katesii]|uniref:MarR family transcriptional regulator n=1 Tax=Halomicrobium katesii TaxID=437163 RepID=UPI000364BB1C|nr:helix-turn-helix domain-containing protein [Halomicrobium katesii]